MVGAFGVHRLALSLMGALIAGNTQALADDADVLAGRRIAQQGVLAGHVGCAACHLENGAGQPDVGIPRLAGLHLDYLDQQLSYFASGQRQNAVMRPYARMLDARQRQQVAAYYASLAVPRPVEADAPPLPLLEQGQRIVEYGSADADMPSCSQCHGVSGLGVGDFSPALAGQSAAYIAQQLTDWHDGSRRDPKGIFMQAEALRLSHNDIAAVAAYLAALPAPVSPVSVQKDLPR